MNALRSSNLKQMINGWFVGDFVPACYSTCDFEVAVKRYSAGSYEPKHVHRKATEITVVVSGNVEMCAQAWREGDIIILDPNECTDFRAITDAVCVVVKTPSVTSDKFTGEIIND